MAKIHVPGGYYYFRPEKNGWLCDVYCEIQFQFLVIVYRRWKIRNTGELQWFLPVNIGNTNDDLKMWSTIAYFTVVCLITWPMNEQLDLHNKSSFTAI